MTGEAAADTTTHDQPAPHDQPGHEHHTNGPTVSNPDSVAALLCMRTARQIQAVLLIHGGNDLEPHILNDCHSEPKQVQALMRIGPIYHLGPLLNGFSWSRPHTKDNNNYVISLSKYRPGRHAERFTFRTIEDMARKARALNAHHAYVWDADPENPDGPGYWSYVRTMPSQSVLIPFEYRNQGAVHILQHVLEAGPPPDPDDDDLFEYPYPYSQQPPPPGMTLMVELDSGFPNRLCIAIHSDGRLLALVPQDHGHSKEAHYEPIPLTAEETATLRNRLADTYITDRAGLAGTYITD